MKPAPTLFVVTTEQVLKPRVDKREGKHVIQTGFALVEPRVRYATTQHWLAWLVAKWLGGTITHDRQALQEHQCVFDDYL